MLAYISRLRTHGQSGWLQKNLTLDKLDKQTTKINAQNRRRVCKYKYFWGINKQEPKKCKGTTARTKTSRPLWSKCSLPIQQRFCRRISHVGDTARPVDSDVVSMLRGASVSLEILVMSTNHYVTVQTPCLVHVSTDRRYPTYIQAVPALLQ